MYRKKIALKYFMHIYFRIIRLISLFKGHVINKFQTKQAAHDAAVDVASAARKVMGQVTC